MLYTPSFGEPISLATQSDVTVALPMVVAGDAPAATLELRRGAETLETVPLPAETPLAGRPADARGSSAARRRSRLGIYELRVTVTHGGQRPCEPRRSLWSGARFGPGDNTMTD